MSNFIKISRLLFVQVFSVISIVGLTNERVQEQLRFNYITIDEGIGNNRVRGLAQDEYGFIWIGTQTDVSRYDGNTLKSYLQYYDDSVYVDFTETREIFSDSKGRLWIAGIYGICLYNAERDRFDKFLPEGIEEFRRSGGIGEDSKGILWFTARNGLMRYDPETGSAFLFVQESNSPKAPETGNLDRLLVAHNDDVWYGLMINGVGYYNQDDSTFHHFWRDGDDPTTLGENRIERIYEGSEGDIWIGHNNLGISRYNYKTGTFKRYMPEPDRKESGRVRGIIEDTRGKFWFGTMGGVYLFDKHSETFRRYAYADHPISSLSHNSVQTMLLDNQEGLWIGTFAGGVSFTNLNTSGFVKYDYSKFNSRYYLNDKSVYGLAFDNLDNIWVATENGGLNFLDRETGEFTYYKYDPEDENTIRSNNVKTVFVDSDGIVWAGTYKGGFSKYDPKTNQFTHYNKDEYYPAGVEYSTFYSITQDYVDKNILWVGSTNRLLQFNIADENFSLVDVNNPDFSNTPEFSRINSICHAPGNKIVFGSIVISILDRNTNEFNNISEIEGEKITSTDFVHIDKNGYLWAWVNSSYIARVSLDSTAIQKFDASKGLPSGVDFLSCTSDYDGNLWLSSNKGVYKLNGIVENQDTVIYTHYKKSDNLQSREFIVNSVAQSSSGEILFGGINGFNSFYPENVKPNKFVPIVQITDLEILGNKVKVGEEIEGRVILEQPVFETQKLKFHHKIKLFSFDYVGLYYQSANNIRYKYMLEGFDKDWKIVEANVRSATYSNIPKGKYIFKVDAANSNGVWSGTPREIEIKITPPFWKRIWFIVFVILIIALVIYGMVVAREKQLKNDKKILEEENRKGKEEVEKNRLEIENQRKILEEKEIQERLQRWHNEGISKFSEVLTKEKDDIEKFCSNIVNFLIEYIKVQQIAIFLENKDNTGKSMLELTASYTMNEAVLANQKMETGEGQIGACYSSKEIIRIDNLPPDYFTFSSGLGESPLTHLLLIPILHDELIVGVLEFVSFQKVEDYKIEFLQKITESIVSVVSNLQSNQIIQKMLDQSQEQAEVLKAQEEEMRQNMEEMMATQEEASRKEELLMAEMEELKKKLGDAGIDVEEK